MLVKLISEPADRDEFSRNWQSMTGMTVSENYFSSLKLYGFYIDDALIGGFGIAFGDDMAWPKLTDSSGFLEKDINLRDCAEINVLWIKSEFRRSALDSIGFWWKVCAEIARQRAGYITFACEDIPSKASLMNRYKTIGSGLLYNGPITKYEGRRMKVWWTTPFKFRFTKLIFAKEYIRLFRRDFSRRKSKTLDTSSIGETT